VTSGMQCGDGMLARTMSMPASGTVAAHNAGHVMTTGSDAVNIASSAVFSTVWAPNSFSEESGMSLGACIALLLGVVTWLLMLRAPSAWRALSLPCYRTFSLFTFLRVGPTRLQLCVLRT